MNLNPTNTNGTLNNRCLITVNKQQKLEHGASLGKEKKRLLVIYFTFSSSDSGCHDMSEKNEKMFSHAKPKDFVVVVVLVVLVGRLVWMAVDDDFMLTPKSLVSTTRVVEKRKKNNFLLLLYYSAFAS